MLARRAKSMRDYRTETTPPVPLLTYAVRNCDGFKSVPSIAAHVHCLVFEGPDARRFAQAQFSGDVDALLPGHWQWNAWLDAHGRVRALMQLADPGDGRLLALLRGGDARQIEADLAHFRLRAEVQVTTRFFGGATEGSLTAGTVVTGPADVVFGYGNRSLRLLLPDDEVDPAAANHWRLTDIRAGWPTLPVGDPAFLPPALGLERLGAVAFDKGCYPGQEIAARLHYRGGHKLGLFHIRGPASLQPGASLAGDEPGAIRVLDSVPCYGLNEALVVASRSTRIKINILRSSYDVVSRFNA
jgi:folate-binding protein YgfZ